MKPRYAKRVLRARTLFASDAKKVLDRVREMRFREGMTVVTHIIDGKMGGVVAAAKLLGLEKSTVSSWKRRGSIPAWWQQKIIDATKNSKRPVRQKDFFSTTDGD